VLKLDNKFLNLELITPEGILLADQVKKVKLFTSLGGLTILPNHAELKSDIVSGTLKISFYEETKGDIKYDVGDGVIEVTPSTVTIIASSAKERIIEDPYKL
jgi:F0F1-type ATP synthase epsilon subunit